jgi:FkbM family methyltransferase
MISRFKKLIKGEKKIFSELCRTNNLGLNYHINKNEFGTLKSIFEEREYSDYFPFYKKVNIIDIGAHYGYFSIFSKNNTDKNSSIIAVEPGKSNFKRLLKNIEDCKLTNISCYNYAIGGNSGLSKLHHGLTLNNSIVENYSLLSRDESYEEVEVKTLEELIIENKLEEIEFMKMDCEGAEYSILENTPRYIFDRIITISMEFHDLKDNNFTGERLNQDINRKPL